MEKLDLETCINSNKDWNSIVSSLINFYERKIYELNQDFKKELDSLKEEYEQEIQKIIIENEKLLEIKLMSDK